MKNRLYHALAIISILPLLGLLGCNIDSGDETVRTIGVQLSGFYSAGGGSIISPANTGATITSLNLVQTGDRLEAVDNNGQLFRGTVGSVVDSTASFNMSGSTTAGNEAVIAGSFTISGTSSVMSGTWAEPALFGVVSASATVGGLIDSGDGGSGNLAIGGSTANLSVSSSRTFTASGGTGVYSWDLSSNALGSPDTGAGSSFTYTADATGSQTITLTSGSDQQTVTFTQN